MKNRYKSIVIKVGTSVITDEKGNLDLNSIQNLVAQISEVKKQGTDVILVSSGAMGCGRAMLKNAKEDTSSQRQLLAGVGQAYLMQTYSDFFGKHGFLCAQVLALKDNFYTREQYRNMRACFEEALKEKIVPVVNENDVISAKNLMFSDNDELAGLIASMLNSDALLMLTNVDGVYDKNPDDEGAQMLTKVEPGTFNMQECILSEVSKNGNGGMCSKCEIAQKISSMGIPVHISNGRTDGVISSIVSGEDIGTMFIPEKRASVGKRWVGMCEGQEKGSIFLNKCAVEVMHDKAKATSLLPVGVVGVLGDFSKGDIVKICTENGTGIGTGMAECTDEEVRSTMGKKGEKPVVHYDYLFLYT